jgi:hypothetical protein
MAYAGANDVFTVFFFYYLVFPILTGTRALFTGNKSLVPYQLSYFREDLPETPGLSPPVRHPFEQRGYEDIYR